VTHFLTEHPEFEPEIVEALWFVSGENGSHRMWPHKLLGEGHFAAVLKKTGGEETDLDIPGGEKRDDFQKRINKIVRDLAEKHPGETILICTHGGALQRIFRMVTGLLDESNILPASTNASISMIEFQHEVQKWRLLNWNITDHLNGLHLNELFVH
jgi:broad specificity phosphatase PhoE